MRLMSFCTSPTVAANNAVVAPMNITNACAFGASSNSGDSRATMKTPAVTMVARLSPLFELAPNAQAGQRQRVGMPAEEVDGLAGQARRTRENRFQIDRA